MASPLLTYFAGIRTVVVALGVGFGGGWYLSSSEPKKDNPRLITAREEPPAQPVPVSTRPERAYPPQDERPAAAPEPAATTGAAPGNDWVALPPPQTTTAPAPP